MKIPWKRITTLTAAGAACTFTLLTGLAVIGLRQEMKAAEEAERFANRWTDKNRFPS